MYMREEVFHEVLCQSRRQYVGQLGPLSLTEGTVESSEGSGRHDEAVLEGQPTPVVSHTGVAHHLGEGYQGVVLLLERLRDAQPTPVRLGVQVAARVEDIKRAVSGDDELDLLPVLLAEAVQESAPQSAQRLCRQEDPFTLLVFSRHMPHRQLVAQPELGVFHAEQLDEPD